MTLTVIQNMLIIIFETLCIIILIGAFFHKRKECNTLAAMGLIAAKVLGTALISVLFYDNQIIKSIIIIFFSTLLFFIYFEAKLLLVFYIYLLQYGINISIDYMMINTIKYIFPKEYLEMMNHSVSSVFLALLCKTIFFFVVVCIRIFWNKEEGLHLIVKKEWALFFFFPLFTFFSVTIFFKNTFIIDQYAPIFYFVAFGLIFVNVTAFYLIKDIVSKENALRNIELIQQSTKSQMAAYSNLNEEYAKQKKFMHDYKNQIGCIQGMLTNGRTEEAISYITSLGGSMITELGVFNTGNSIIDAVINQKYSIAKSKGIDITFAINSLHDIPMREEDIVSLFANLFDNAIEACEKLENKKLIMCKIMEKNNQLIVALSNPVKDEIRIENGKIITTKKERSIHGIGLLNVQTIIEKYHGDYTIDCRNHEFSFYALIPL